MIDVIVAGAGPAGSVAALVLARAGARVWLLDRDEFPRPKLCGDTLNPGAVATLASLGLTGGPLDTARRLAGFWVTSPRVAVCGRYGSGDVGLALTRAALDGWLVAQAVAAGARLETGVRVQGPIWGDGPEPVVAGVTFVRAASGPAPVRLSARMTIAADGRRSVLARACGLASQPAWPRRWAFGGHATDVEGLGDCGEMHVRARHYIGVAPMPDGLATVCVVTGPRPDGRTAEDIVRRALRADPRLAERLAHARFVSPVRVLGPLAVDARRPGVPGLLLAGDAAGFVDPITGDGMHLAIRGGVLAANAALAALESGDLAAAVRRLEADRGDAFGSKLRVNRAIRALVGSPMALDVAGVGAQWLPGVLRKVVRVAGDAA